MIIFKLSSEALPEPTISLKNIPQILLASGKIYELRSVDCFRQRLSRLYRTIYWPLLCMLLIKARSNF
ncbi:DUF4806 domain-containing protein [Aphis craccivora]|uniref:DUF4806 domain-containing protein n=1 Tax=Aphis craccivora TaxID=307492 RepID=A0A6G0YG00_APHCR|nr:DUF4806 domain-containing protein [Aphis craccivora]